MKLSLALGVAAAGLGIMLAQTPPKTRAVYLASLRAAFDTSSAVPVPAPQPADRTGPVAAAAIVDAGLGRGTTALDANGYGQYVTDMDIGGRNVSALVDTGATFVSLSYEDAASLGIHPDNRAFTVTMQTANGVARSAPVMIPHIKVGFVEAYNVQAMVSAPGALTQHSLLGMSFLQKLSGFRIDNGRLLLRQ